MLDRVRFPDVKVCAFQSHQVKLKGINKSQGGQFTRVARIKGMVVLVGIHKTGFGLIPGPLIVSSSTFSPPHHLLSSDLSKF